MLSHLRSFYDQYNNFSDDVTKNIKPEQIHALFQNITYKDLILSLKLPDFTTSQIVPTAISLKDFNHAYFILHFYQHQIKKHKSKSPKHQNKAVEHVQYFKEAGDIPKSAMKLSTDPNYLINLTENCIDEHDNLDKDNFKGASDEDSEVKVFENSHQVSMIKLKCNVHSEQLKNPDKNIRDFVNSMVSYVGAQNLVESIDVPDCELLQRYQETSAKEPKYIEACECLHINHLDSTISLANNRTITLMSWQVQGVDFILSHELREIDGGGLDNDCDLSKTIQMFMAIHMASKFHKIMKLMLILCPVNIIHIWLSK
ncbi:hypothetical protein EMPG_13525 [Blastomyces silverae]|uniref:Uncharacterized protein n=1 Tax=Blastomyces silverae TaxID=2060906 RepID=A0A0H1BIJ0_9EURO|nr:hypothetical protein EMPG_13525 [Blastomyces silverae]